MKKLLTILMLLAMSSVLVGCLGGEEEVPVVEEDGVVIEPVVIEPVVVEPVVVEPVVEDDAADDTTTDAE